MKTHHRDDGTPFQFDDLRNAFSLRMRTTKRLIDALAVDSGRDALSNDLQDAMLCLAEDWDDFDSALADWHDRTAAGGQEVVR